MQIKDAKEMILAVVIFMVESYQKFNSTRFNMFK